MKLLQWLCSLQNEKHNTVRIGYLVFCNTNGKITRFLKKGFKHIFLIQMTPDDITFVFDPTRCLAINSAYIGNSEQQVVNAVRNVYQDAKILKYRIERTYTPFSFLFCLPRLFTCVTLVQYMAGIPMFCLTPYGFYKKLIKKNWIEEL